MSAASATASGLPTSTPTLGTPTPRVTLTRPTKVSPPVVNSSSPCYGPSAGGDREFVINGRYLLDQRNPGQGSVVYIPNRLNYGPPRFVQTTLENTDTKIRIKLMGFNAGVSGSLSIWVSNYAGDTKVCDYAYLGVPQVQGFGVYKDAAALASKRLSTSLPTASGGIVDIFGEGLVDPANNLSDPVRLAGGCAVPYLNLDVRNIQVKLPPLNLIPAQCVTKKTVTSTVSIVVTTPYGSAPPIEVRFS